MRYAIAPMIGFHRRDARCVAISLAGLALLVTLVPLLSSCAVGPNFHPPRRPTQTRYTAKALPRETAATPVPGGEAQRFNFGQSIPGQWWTVFGSAKLDGLIERAMAHYPSIAAQQAALREARENVRAEEGAFVPALTGSGYAARTRQSGATIAPGFPGFIFNVFQATVNVSYTFDIFGKERRTLEQLEAESRYRNFQLEASYLTLTSNVVSTAVEIAALRDEIAATREIVSLEQKQLTVIQERFRLGAQTRADILQQQANVASVRATLPPLQQQLSAAEHALAVLTGRSPADTPELKLSLSDLRLPRNLPVTLPSVLVEQRPDIRAQEAVVHEASAAIGVATADLLPQLTLSGDFGDESLSMASLIDPTSNVWSLSGNLTAPLFEGGRLLAKRRAAVDAYEQAAAQYRLVVLSAFEDVANTLTALGNDAHALASERDALEASQASLELIQKQYAVGAVAYTSLLVAQRSFEQARLGYLRAVARRYTDTVTLFQALGGGWWHRQDPGTLPVRR